MNVYESLPTRVNAQRFTEAEARRCLATGTKFLGMKVHGYVTPRDEVYGFCIIDTPHGQQRLETGDWLVEDLGGVRYALSHNVFSAKYREVEA